MSLKDQDGTTPTVRRKLSANGLWIRTVETSQELNRKLATKYYSRMRLTKRLLPLIQAASSLLSQAIWVLVLAKN